MKKGLFAGVLAVLLSLFVSAPAFAGTLNSNEKALLDRFDQIMGEVKYFDHYNQYHGEAENALTNDAIDLDATAKADFDKVLNEIEGKIAGKTQAQAWEDHVAIINSVNSVAKNYKMEVSVDPKSKDAKVTILSNDGKKSVVASTSKVVRQTGFDMGQAAVVVAGAVVVLGGAFAFARKNDLFA